EWALRVPGRKPVRSRMQLVLDLSREDVRQHIYKSICAILDSANIAYVKWDMNRSISDWFSGALPAESQGELSHRYVLGVYELLGKITSRYPHVLFEGCCGGGGRFDPGMLSYHPQIWCSDNTDPIERLKIQYGTSFAYPVSAVASHVSAVPNHQTGRVTSLETRGVVAMSGSFGYELDLTQLSESEKSVVTRQIEAYKSLQDIIHNGLYFRLTSPYDCTCAYTAWMFVSEDKETALLHVVATHTTANPAHIHLKLRGLDPEAAYTVSNADAANMANDPVIPGQALTTGQAVITGQALMHAGLAMQIPPTDYPAWQVTLRRANTGKTSEA
ncbi:MAG: alpha-galactosidase, partial [Oscillospiraceae bacterium]|nr:alpha-galactosidase [Oscillospiraceae bacterium]